MANYYYRNGEETKGPFNLVEMEMLARTKQFTDDMFFCREGADQWMLLEKIPELKPLLPLKRIPEKSEDDIAVGAGLLFLVALIACGVLISNARGYYVSESDKVLAVAVPVWLVLGAVVGGLLGSIKSRFYTGAILGGLFGAIGWLLTILVLRDYREACPSCLSPVSEEAHKCRHCGSDLVVEPHEVHSLIR